MYYVYFAQSQKNNKVYVGKTSKLPAERVKEHNLGTNKWTKQNGPFKLVFYETYYCSKDAAEREEFYKSGFGRVIKQAILNTLKTINYGGYSSVG